MPVRHVEFECFQAWLRKVQWSNFNGPRTRAKRDLPSLLQVDLWIQSSPQSGSTWFHMVPRWTMQTESNPYCKRYFQKKAVANWRVSYANSTLFVCSTCATFYWQAEQLNLSKCIQGEVRGDCDHFQGQDCFVLLCPNGTLHLSWRECVIYWKCQKPLTLFGLLPIQKPLEIARGYVGTFFCGCVANMLFFHVFPGFFPHSPHGPRYGHWRRGADPGSDNYYDPKKCSSRPRQSHVPDTSLTYPETSWNPTLIQH